MAEANNEMHETLITLTSDIVAAHVGSNNVGVGELPQLITNVSHLGGRKQGKFLPREKPGILALLTRTRVTKIRSVFMQSTRKRGRNAFFH